ncbi:murein DD-endopeptidase MepM/ murein hydrolase activator NlpD [Povalibacter uvarum]|uniref:Murein DD-endopeptidase MepM/ murein hydrolase activator NlpD n=1 Tax=Povalibacter uvarum TaxID=732238 RepID=A0A841HSR3_9GAMM|nr:M23 family metallopeptidase [Povalibacter uvarum]MBB6094905.1 murein DD-endopeptidase MepM/ murein hydrolase activator NlpD [Povalibacter uvarum]
MNVIVFSRRLGRARQIELGRPLAATVTIALVVSVFAGVLFAGVQLGRSSLFEPTTQVAEWGRKLEDQRLQVIETKQELQNRMDAIASRVGQMNAHVIRLDALGRRLTEMANLDKGEFDFTNPPAVGGPEGLVEGAVATSPDISAMLDSLTRQIKDREQQLSVLESLISTRNLNRQIVPGGRPVMQGWISSYFGQRTDPFNGRTAYHRGVDFAGPAGSQVVAVASGVVTYSKDRFGYGKTVEINHGNGYVTRYAHNQRTLVTPGDTVQKGQAIALIGSTGRSTGPHLHFEVLRNGRAVDPMSFVRQ